MKFFACRETWSVTWRYGGLFMGVVIKWEWLFEAWFIREAWSIYGRGN